MKLQSLTKLLGGEARACVQGGGTGECPGRAVRRVVVQEDAQALRVDPVDLGQGPSPGNWKSRPPMVTAIRPPAGSHGSER